MDFILENLRSLIPILIPIIWILRLVSKRRERRGGAEQDGGSQEDVGQPLMGHIFHEKEDMNRYTEAQSKPPKKSLSESVEQVPYPAVHLHRDFSRELANETGMPRVLKRIDRLPPLARGMVWSFILDNPLSIKERT